VPLLGDQSLFQASALRLSGPGYAAPLVLTTSDFRFIVAEQLSGSDINPSVVLIEPEGRGTAPAILAAALWLEKTSPDEMMLVAPSDHLVLDVDAFQAAVALGEKAARAGQLVNFGIQPTRAETGYAYLELDGSVADPGPIRLKSYVEKPDTVTAETMLSDGNFLWDAGVYLFTARTVIEAFTIHASDFLEPVHAAVDAGKQDLGLLCLDPRAWAQTNNTSIAYAVMERADNLSVVPFAGGLFDLGAWDAVWRETPHDSSGVGLSGQATAIACEDTLLRSEDASLELVGIGLQNIVAVAMPDAVLVADMSRAQEVKLAVSALKEKQATQAEGFPKDFHPWGRSERLVAGDRFQVNHMVIHPGATLSMQSHHHRSEHWIAIEGTAKVVVDEIVKLVSENESIFIPSGKGYSMENPGKVPTVLIKVTTDIHRVEI
jgi:mannose-1-phosphate guanylyltransferase/mannose-1-phosphate guanylyltransferase/mannose-6-phosphate isomerase